MKIDPELELIKVLPNVILLRFTEAYHQGMCLWRYQEYYESPRWKGKTPSFWEFSQHYASTVGYGCMSYPADIDGYNFPYHVVRKVNEYARAFTPYDTFIKPVLAKLDGQCTYMIGMARDTTYSTLKHEVAHALWFTNRSYQAEARKLLKSVPKVTMESWELDLKAEKTYHPSVWKDEMNAYLATGVVEGNNILPLEKVSAQYKKFQNLFKTYSKDLDLKQYLYG